MSLPIVLDPEAREEFDEAYDYYESKQAGLGETFADAIQAVASLLAKLPRIHQVVLQNIRRAVVRGFPYCIYYREEPTQVRILAIFHARRDPSDWQSRA